MKKPAPTVRQQVIWRLTTEAGAATRALTVEERTQVIQDALEQLRDDSDWVLALEAARSEASTWAEHARALVAHRRRGGNRAGNK
jgi:hypothetical protein